MTLVIDARERQLIKLFGSDVQVQTLDVGDILCEYEDGNSWIAERKTADDLARSIIDGRWEEQKSRLMNTGKKVIYIIEGDIRNTRFSYEALLGVCVDTTLTDGAILYRTCDIVETKLLIQQLAKKFQSSVTLPPRSLGITNKRKKDSEVETIWLRQLMCIPMISEGVARSILKHFGNINDLREALKAPKDFPEIHISPSSKLGKARISKLAEVFASE